MLALVAMTYAYLRATRALAYQVGAHVAAMARAVELGQAQRRDAARPVLVVTVRALAPETEPTMRRFRLILTNAGTGPAFDIVVTPVGMPAVTEVVGSTAAEAGAFLGVGEALTLDFAADEAARWGAGWGDPGGGQPAGELLVAYRDSFNGERTTRARLATTRRLESDDVYGLRVASQRFGE